MHVDPSVLLCNVRFWDQKLSRILKYFSAITQNIVRQMINL